MTDVNLGYILSTTLKKHRKTLTDNIFKSNAIFYMLKEKGAIKTEDGGERIVEPIMYGTNSTAGSYSGYDRLDITPQDGIDSAEFNWKQYSASITISGEEERKNSGKTERIIKILGARTQQAEMSLTEELTTGIFSDGTGNSNKDLTGLEAMVLDSGIYGGIDSSTYTWWASTVDSDSVPLALSDIRTNFNTISKGGKDTPNLIVTTQTLFEKFEAFLTNVSATNIAGAFQTRSEGEKKLGDAGFQTLAFKGTPIVWDELAPSGTWYHLNLRHMDLTIHKDANFETTDFVKPEDQDARVAQILWMGNMTCNRRASLGKLTSKS